MSIKLVDTEDMTPDVAIVGGGASGTLLASHLLRAGGARVVLIERGERIGRGVAYGTDLRRPPPQRAGREHERAARRSRSISCATCARHHDAAAEPTTFVPRLVYGAYLEALLTESAAAAGPAHRSCAGRARSPTSRRARARAPGC